jgi:hypothetical protein
MANMEHWCDNCCSYIYPGQLYEASVQAYGKGRLMVFKEHVDPCCEMPEEPDYDEENSTIFLDMDMAAWTYIGNISVDFSQIFLLCKILNLLWVTYFVIPIKICYNKYKYKNI